MCLTTAAVHTGHQSKNSLWQASYLQDKGLSHQATSTKPDTLQTSGIRYLKPVLRSRTLPLCCACDVQLCTSIHVPRFELFHVRYSYVRLGYRRYHPYPSLQYIPPVVPCSQTQSSTHDTHRPPGQRLVCIVPRPPGQASPPEADSPHASAPSQPPYAHLLSITARNTQ